MANDSNRKINSESTRLAVYPLTAAELNFLKTDCEWSLFNVTRYLAPLHANIRTTLQTGRSRVRLPMVSLDFFSGIILSVALWPWGRLNL